MSGQRISQSEFIAMMAMLVATVALTIDAMLPALTRIAEELSPADPNRAQLIVTSMIFGMGVGTFFVGPLSDRFGRRPVLYGGAVVYVVGAALAWASGSLETMLLARMLQGLGAAAPRIVATAIVRDLYSGREMARLISFVMIIFTLVPAFAPSVGAALIALAGWRAIFAMFAVFSLTSVLWVALRLAEPLPVSKRRPLNFMSLWSGTKEILSYPSVRTSIGAQALGFGMLFSMISTVQPIYEVTFDRGHEFHLWFGGIALLSGAAGFLNSAIVMRVGMRRIVTVTFAAQIGFSTLMLLATQLLSAEALFYAFVLWQVSVFFQAGMCLGNLNALAMEPLGHLAGLGASVIGALATVMSVLLAIPVGLAFDGTPVPLVIGILIFAICATGLMLRLRGIEARDGVV